MSYGLYKFLFLTLYIAGMVAVWFGLKFFIDSVPERLSDIIIYGMGFFLAGYVLGDRHRAKAG